MTCDMVLAVLEASWNVMAPAQKPDFVFRQNGRVHLNRWGASVQSTTGSRDVCISGSNAAYTMFQGSVKGTGYPLHSPVSPSLPLPCATVCHHISTGVYHTELLDSQRALLESFVRYFGNRMSFINCSMTLCYWNINTQLLVTIVSCFRLCCMSAITLHHTCCVAKCGISNTRHS